MDSTTSSGLVIVILGWAKGAEMDLFPMSKLMNFPQYYSCSLLLQDSYDFWNSLRTFLQFESSLQQGRQLRMLFSSVTLIPTLFYRIFSMYSTMQITNCEKSFSFVYLLLYSTICLKLSFICRELTFESEKHIRFFILPALQ